MKKKVMLIILDGWGASRKLKGNAVRQARTPNIDFYQKNFPNTLLACAGESVGLPKGQMGNSEIGHMTIGAGRIIKSDIVRINKAIRDSSFFRNKILLNAVKHVKEHGSALHLLGLLSDGGVHSHISHLFALLKLAKLNNIKKRIYLHCILDGRDTPPASAEKYFGMLFREIKKLKIRASVATIMGRYYGMDRDNRWHREHKAYDAMVNKNGRRAVYGQLKDSMHLNNQPALINKILGSYYKQGITDEFIPPTITGRGTVEKKDSIIFFNFRSDRARELARAFVEGRFKGFKRKRIINLHFVCLTQYDSKIKASAAFPPAGICNSLGEIIASHHLFQLRAAETEKYAHVTFFFNCGRETPFSREERILIPSLKVRTYDKKPAMSAFKLTDALIRRIRTKSYSLIAVNFANGDMVGHTGILKAAVKSCETVDKCLKLIVQSAKDYKIILTADHGNCEDMNIHKTAHSLNPVLFVLLDKSCKLKKGSLKDIAPTVLNLLGLKKPGEMTGKSLIC